MPARGLWDCSIAALCDWQSAELKFRGAAVGSKMIMESTLGLLDRGNMILTRNRTPPHSQNFLLVFLFRQEATQQKCQDVIWRINSMLHIISIYLTFPTLNLNKATVIRKTYHNYYLFIQILTYFEYKCLYMFLSKDGSSNTR